MYDREDEEEGDAYNCVVCRRNQYCSGRSRAPSGSGPEENNQPLTRANRPREWNSSSSIRVIIISSTRGSYSGHGASRTSSHQPTLSGTRKEKAERTRQAATATAAAAAGARR